MFFKDNEDADQSASDTLGEIGHGVKDAAGHIAEGDISHGLKDGADHISDALNKDGDQTLEDMNVSNNDSDNNVSADHEQNESSHN